MTDVSPLDLQMGYASQFSFIPLARQGWLIPPLHVLR